MESIINLILILPILPYLVVLIHGGSFTFSSKGAIPTIKQILNRR